MDLFKSEQRTVMTFQKQGDGWVARASDPEPPSTLTRLAKVAVAATIFIAASCGEGMVNYCALLALFLVYLMAVG